MYSDGATRGSFTRTGLPGYKSCSYCVFDELTSSETNNGGMQLHNTETQLIKPHIPSQTIIYIDVNDQDVSFSHLQRCYLDNRLQCTAALLFREPFTGKIV